MLHSVLVPLIVQGVGVAGGRSHQGLLSVTDLFATLVELAGGSKSQANAEDSISFAAALAGERGESEREFAFTQVQARLPFPGGPPIEMNADALRDQRHKLIRINGAEELYDLLADPLEARNLLAGETDAETKAAYARLSEQLDTLLGSEAGYHTYFVTAIMGAPYDMRLEADARAYQQALFSTPGMRAWTDAALRETEFLPADEPYAQGAAS